jgi:DNA-binding SARP family transcriptional activator
MQFRILGPVEVRVDGGWNSISATKWRTVLAVLLLRAGEVVSTDQLISEVWPEDAPATAVNLISVYVLRLRRLIGDPDGQILVTRSRGYQLLATPDDIDAQRFTRLAAEGRAALSAGDGPKAARLLGEAVGLWHGSRALADVPDSEVVSAAASGLGEARIAALELRINADLGCGRHAQVVPELRRLLAEHPLREGLWALLMRALYGSGRLAEALGAYAQAREVIAEELGSDPSAELQQLHEQMLRSGTGSGPQFSATKTAAADSPFMAQPSVARAGIPPPAAGGTDSAAAGPGPAEAGPGSAEAGPGPAEAGPDSAAAGPPPVTGYVRSVVLSQVAQLPADIPDFTGRAEHVQKLHDLLAGPGRPDSPGAVVVAAVIGAGGLGKTTLAVHAAHQLRSHFPDGQLYANLHGASAQLVPPGDVLARFLRDLGMDPERIPAGEEERAAQFRSWVTDRKVLIVLDDAKDAAHVRPLLPGSASCAVLVTTRSRMPDLAGSRFVDLDVLEPAEATDMFAGIIGRDRAEAEPEATADVVTACAGLPLAIRIAGARLAARGGWSVRTIATRLADQRRRLDWLRTGDLAVRACFEVSFSSLPRSGSGGVDPAHAFRMLGLWQGPTIGLAAAAALLGQPDEDVAEALEILVDAQLLQAPAPDRYRFHDLLRAYAAERATADEPEQARMAAVRRLLDWYLHSVAGMARIVSPNRDQVPLDPPGGPVEPLSFAAPDEALNWCETERTNLVVATRQAAAGGLDAIAWKLPVAALSFFNRRTYRAEWVTTHRIALASAGRAGDRAAEAWVLNSLGIVYAQQGLPEAIACFEQALTIRREAGDERGEAQAANNLANTYLLLRRFGELEPFQQALAIQRRLGYRFGEAVALNNLGEAYRHLGRLDESISCLDLAGQIFSAVGDTHGEGYAWHYLGQAFLESGRVDEALDHLTRALRVRRAGGERLAEAQTLTELGRAQRAADRPEDARQSWSRALSVFEALDDQAQAVEVRAELATIDARTVP